MKSIRKASAEEVGRKYGFRSGLEEENQSLLDAHGVPYEYEEYTLGYTPPVKLRKYTPDFFLANGIIVETKGRFVTADRQKIKMVKTEFPELDLRFVFSNSRAKISKGSKTTYGLWCKRLGIPYADKLIPLEWTQEPYDERRVRAFMQACV